LRSTEDYFRTNVRVRTMDEVAEEYAARDVLGIILDWNDHTLTGRPWAGNEWMASLAERFPGVLMGFGSLDPHAPGATEEIRRCSDLGLRGLKFHPTIQQFHPNGETYYPLWEEMQEAELIALFHTGTSGISGGTPGGGRLKISYSHPRFLDSVAADFPGLVLIAAHFGWPWFLECLAIAMHKSNVWIDLSGWAPSLLPDEVKREVRHRLSRQTLFGSDYPFISVDRCLEEFDALEFTEEVKQAVLRENASRLLRL